MVPRKTIGLYWLLLLFVVSVVFMYVQRRDLAGQQQALEERRLQVEEGYRLRDNLKVQVDEAKRHVENLGSDPVEIEASVRHSKNLVREGDMVYRIEDTPKKEMSAIPAAGTTATPAQPVQSPQSAQPVASH